LDSQQDSERVLFLILNTFNFKFNSTNPHFHKKTRQFLAGFLLLGT